MKMVNPTNPDSPFIKPSESVDREEALIICEYKADMSGKQVVWRFSREGKKSKRKLSLMMI